MTSSRLLIPRPPVAASASTIIVPHLVLVEAGAEQLSAQSASPSSTGG